MHGHNFVFVNVEQERKKERKKEITLTAVLGSLIREGSSNYDRCCMHHVSFIFPLGIYLSVSLGRRALTFLCASLLNVKIKRQVHK